MNGREDFTTNEHERNTEKFTTEFHGGNTELHGEEGIKIRVLL
jgi:hypothetical protein